MAYTSTGGRVIPVTPSDTNYITGLTWAVENTEIIPTSVTVASDIFTKASSGLANGDIIVFDTLGTVTGISINKQYYIVGVSGNDFSVSETYGGSAVNLTGANTTVPTLRKIYDIQTGRTPGYIDVRVSGDVAILPLSHFDTNTTTEADLGCQIVYINAGVPYPCKVKKVFSTGTTATGIKCITDK